MCFRDLLSVCRLCAEVVLWCLQLERALADRSIHTLKIYYRASAVHVLQLARILDIRSCCQIPLEELRARSGLNSMPGASSGSRASAIADEGLPIVANCTLIRFFLLS